MYDYNELEKEAESIKKEATKDIINFRKDLVPWVKKFIITYVIVVVVLVILSSLCLPSSFCISFMIPENVLIALISSSAVEIIGLMAIVLKGLFSFEDKKEKEQIK